MTENMELLINEAAELEDGKLDTVFSEPQNSACNRKKLQALF